MTIDLCRSHFVIIVYLQKVGFLVCLWNHVAFLQGVEIEATEFILQLFESGLLTCQ